MTEIIEFKDRETSKERRAKIQPHFWVDLTALRILPPSSRPIQSHIALNWDEAVDLARKILELNEK